jgi:hypothetical protein
VNTDTDIIQQPSAWKRLLITNTLGRYTFNDNKTPWPFTFFNKYTEDSFYVLSAWITNWFDVENLDTVLPFVLFPSMLVLLFVTAAYTEWCRHHIVLFMLFALSLPFWPVLLLLIIGVVGFSALSLLYFPVRGLMIPLAMIFCRAELPYYRMRNQARIDARVNFIIEKANTEEPSWWKTQTWWSECAEPLKKFSSEY